MYIKMHWYTVTIMCAFGLAFLYLLYHIYDRHKQLRHEPIITNLEYEPPILNL